jgi:hypothetical protein
LNKKLSGIILSLLPVLLTGLFPLIALWKNNLGQIRAAVVFAPLLYTVVFILIVFSLWLLVFRSLEKSSLMSLATFLLVFSFGHVYNLISQVQVFVKHIGFIKLFGLYMLLFIIFLVVVIKIKKLPGSLFLFLNLFSGTLVLINLIPIISYSIQIDRTQARTKALPITQSEQVSNRPDIYYIVLDAYARQDILKDVIGYDNSSFIKALKQRGFYIPDCAFSNYDETLLTLTSVLNLNYLDQLDVPQEDLENYIASKVNLILDNQVAKTFRDLGYQFVTGRGYSSFNDIERSDIYLNFLKDQGQKDNLDQEKFASLYLNTTVVRVITELYKNNPGVFSKLPYWLALNRESDPYLKEASFWYYQNNYMFDSLEKIPEMQGDYFVYAHINAPHGPYVFRSDGSFRYPLDTTDNKVLYADTLTYLNKRVLKVVEALQQKSTVPPIIILQADHGIHVLTTGLDKHKILSAYYLPGHLNTPPYSTISPVNDFRLILKNYFDPSVELLPDTLWVKFKNDHEPVTSSCDLNN